MQRLRASLFGNMHTHHFLLKANYSVSLLKRCCDAHLPNEHILVHISYWDDALATMLYTITYLINCRRQPPLTLALTPEFTSHRQVSCRLICRIVYANKKLLLSGCGEVPHHSPVAGQSDWLWNGSQVISWLCWENARASAVNPAAGAGVSGATIQVINSLTSISDLENQ